MYTLKELAELVGGQFIGPDSLPIKSIAPFELASVGDITFADHKRLKEIDTCNASVIIVPFDTELVTRPVIKVNNPRLAFIKVMERFLPKSDLQLGVHRSAVIDESVQLGQNISIQAHVVIEAGAQIGDRVVLCPGVFIGKEAEIGNDTYIFPNVTIRDKVEIGRNAIIHPGSVIGADGFGYEWDGIRHVKVPHIGTVIIEDDVEIGANVTIDRGTLDVTRIGRGTKIDNLVQVGHNVQIGEHCLVVAMSGIAGSAIIGNHVILAGQSAVKNHVKIGDKAVVLACSAVTKDIPSGSYVSGSPARLHQDQLRLQATGSRLPEILRNVKELTSRIKELEVIIRKRPMEE